MKKVLKVLNTVVLMIGIVSACAVDGTSWIPCIVLALCLAYGFAFMALCTKTE